MKKTLLALLFAPTVALAQTYPSPIFNNLTVNGTASFTNTPTFPSPLSIANGGTGASTLTQYSVLLGNGTGAVQSVGPSATAGLPLVSGGSSANPSFSALAVAGGGTGATSASGTALDNITGFSSTGFLTRTGAGTYAFQSLTNGIAYSNLAQAAANTVLANATGSTANVAALAVPSCSATGNALQWTSGTGFTCATGLAPLASPTFTGTPAAPTATAGTSTTQIATTAFVATATAGVLNKSVAGGSNVTLTSAEAGNAVLNLTGALTANIQVIVPATADKWTVVNATTGNFTITVKTASGTGVLVAQGYASNLWTEGTNVYQQMTDYITWFNGLSTTLPATSGVLWNNGGILSKS